MADDQTYTKTGKSGLTSFVNKLSVIPFVGSFAAMALGPIATLWDSGKWLIRGKIGSAATELVTGTVGHVVNAASPFGLGSMGAFWWMGKAGTAAATGHTLGTHARALAEEAIGSVTGALGMTPQVLASYPAGIGALPGAGNYFAQPDVPGYWATRAAQEKGLDPNARHAQFLSGADGREHVSALQNAAMGPQARAV